MFSVQIPWHTVYSQYSIKSNPLKKMWHIYIHIHTHTHTHTHTNMEYYSAIKKNETMPFAAIRTDLEIIILNEVSQKKDNYYLPK